MKILLHEGKQFLDPEDFEYKLELNHPCLYKLYMIFLCIFAFIMILLMLVLPSTVFIVSFFSIAYLDPDEDFQKLKSSIKLILFLTGVFIVIAGQSFGYLILGIFLATISLAIAIIFLLAILDIIKLLMELLCYPCSDYDIECFYFTKNYISWVGNILENMCE